MNTNLIYYNNDILLHAMKEAIKACLIKGWNFNGRARKARDLQLLCKQYEASANPQVAEQFIVLTNEARPFFSFSLFGYRFEFGKANSGNTHSALRFNEVLTQWKKELRDTELPQSYIGLTQQLDHSCVPIAAKEALPLDSEMCYAMQERHYPQPALGDTVTTSHKNQEIRSVHGQGRCFFDQEIIKTLPTTRRKKLGEGFHHFFDQNSMQHMHQSYPIYARYTPHHKAIIQQQAIRSCTAAVAAMLIVDSGKQPEVRLLSSRNLGNDLDIIEDIKRSGLTPIITAAAPNNLTELRSIILSNGPAIVSIDDPEIMAHVIIVDAVSQDLLHVRVRDPYHGWEITVTADAFLKRLAAMNQVIQVSQNDVRLATMASNI